jgi:hypothetical protein
MQDELDRNLQSLFQEKSRTLPEEPFLSDMLKLIDRHQSRRVFRQRLILVLGFACCAILSPFLIKGSILLSGAVNMILRAAENLLSTPTGMLAAALFALLVLFIKRRQAFRFV